MVDSREYPVPCDGKRRPRRPLRYGWALLIAFLGIASRLGLGGVLGSGYNYTVFYPAVLAAGLLCGVLPGMFATALMALFSALWLLPRPLQLDGIVSLALFIVSAVLINLTAGFYRRSRGAVRMAAEELRKRRRTEEALEQSRRDLAGDLAGMTRLHQLATRYVREGELTGVLGEIVDSAIAITHAAKGNLQFFEPLTGTLKIAVARGFSKEWLEFFGEVSGEDTACGQAMRTGKQVIVPDVRTSPIFAQTPAGAAQLKEGVLACQSTPLVSRGGDLLGMLSTHFTEPHTPAERELHWLDLLARQAADLLWRFRAEARLREREAVLRTVTTEARVGLVMVDKARRYLFANQTYADILRLPSGDLVGKRVPDVLAHIYDQVKPNLDRAFLGQRVTYELTMPAANDQGQERFYEVVYQPRTQDVAEPYVVVVIVDVTERRRMLHTLENTVAERTAKLRETVHDLEAFSYSIAHDMRAPLRAMQGFSHLLQEEYGAQIQGGAREYLQRIAASANRLDQLIQDVLDYSKIVRSELALEPVRPGQFIRQIVESYPNLRPPKAEIEVQERIPPVLANPAAFTQVVSNLLGNAVKFVKPGVKPRVRVWSEVRNGRPGPVPGNGHSSTVRLWFEDNGIGIRQELRTRIFKMFQRLNPPSEYEGTGIGLTIVQKAIERMGGRVGVESEPGKGSKFWVELKEATSP